MLDRFEARVERVLESLRELRFRIIKRVAIIVPIFIASLLVTWFYRKAIFTFLLAPADGALSPFGGLPVYTSPAGMMSATFSLGMKVGLVVAFPVILGSILTLVRPLTGRYWGFILVFIAVAGLSFLGGAAFAYYVMLPAAMGFLLSFGDGVAVPVIELPEYIKLFTSLVFWTGVIFTIPPTMFTLTKGGLVTYSTLNSWTAHKLAVGFSMIFAAVLTPTTDLWTYGFMVGPMIGLYEVGLFASWLADPEDGDYLWLKTVALTLHLEMVVRVLRLKVVAKVLLELAWSLAWSLMAVAHGLLIAIASLVVVLGWCLRHSWTLAAGLRRLRDALAWPYRHVKRVLRFMYGEFF